MPLTFAEATEDRTKDIGWHLREWWESWGQSDRSHNGMAPLLRTRHSSCGELPLYGPAALPPLHP